MKHFLLLSIQAVLMSLVLSFSSQAQNLQYQQGVKQRMVKVKFEPTMTQALNTMSISARNNKLTTGIANFDQTAQSVSATNMYRLFPYNAKHEAKLQKHGLHLWYVVELDGSTEINVALTQFSKLKEVQLAELDYQKSIAPYKVSTYTSGTSTSNPLPFNDPLLKDQWHYTNTGQTGHAGGADVNLFEAWQTKAGSSDIIVSIHDEGVDVNHEDLKANMWVNEAELNGTPGVDDDGNGYIDDVYGYNFDKKKGAIDPQYHGTHVAGTVAAVNNNGIGVSGVAGGTGQGDGVKIMSLQILGGGSIENSYVYAANNGAVISQNSWGYTYPGAVEQSVLAAIDYFIAEAGNYAGSPMKGGIVIFASGNSDYDGEWYPGYYPSTFTVSSLGPNWSKAGYSNYGSWVDISAPGGDYEFGVKNGVLSTIPSNGYGYLEGTSMACPHVAGIAALALANRTKQLTAAELRNKLSTGVVSIDEFNPNYVGKLGTGAIDAALSIRNDQKIAPDKINNLTVTGIAQEFATLSWTVPADADDDQPYSFQLYVYTEALNAGNLGAATKVQIANKSTAGQSISYEVSDLLGLTSYHFALTSTDRWGNISLLSNVANATTNAGPAIAVDENSQSISLSIDASASTIATHEIEILNNAEGILRWTAAMRHKSNFTSYSTAHIQYPKVSKHKSANSAQVSKLDTKETPRLKKETAISTASFTPVERNYVWWPTNIIGETDTALTNSAATKFLITEAEGFNLTNVQLYLKHDPAKGPVVMEVYQHTLEKKNLLFAQTHSNWSATEAYANITLEEQLYFEPGSTFWVVFHVPSGNLFPLGIGFEAHPEYSTYCYMSFDLGTTWTPLEQVLESKDFAWAITASSTNEHLGTYLTLSPSEGDINGNEQASTQLSAYADQLVNGSYEANLIISSNDAENRELRIPVNLIVTGHTPSLEVIDILEFGSVFQHNAKTVSLDIYNSGYANFNNPDFQIDNPAFSIQGNAPWQITARNTVSLNIQFKPTTLGNNNGILTITDGNLTYTIALFGVGAETSKINIDPQSQTISDLAIGDEVSAHITVSNDGAYPLKYFIPGYDTKGISNNWPASFHNYGYIKRSNYDEESNPLDYEFQDISGTGINITNSFRPNEYFTVNMGFNFPYYGIDQTHIYIAKGGFTTFDNSVRPINSPRLNGAPWSPAGYISLIGTYLSYVAQGNIFYQLEADRIIIQYDNVWDGYNVGEEITAQIVLFADGNIRFYYDNVTVSESNLQYWNILIEDVAQSDGLLISDYTDYSPIYSGLVLGLDYPGPNIISSVSNGSGIVLPGQSKVIDINLHTESLPEGTINRYINIVNNDPTIAQLSALIQLEITSGGEAIAEISTNSIEFGEVFEGDQKMQTVSIKNTGNALLAIDTIAFENDRFNLQGADITQIKPGLYANLVVGVPTTELADLEDWLLIHYANGAVDSIAVAAQVIAAPGINVDLSTIQTTLAHGEVQLTELTVQNTGLNNLEFIAVGKQWLNFTSETNPAALEYAVEKNNDGSAYQWIDIRKTGTQLPFPSWGDFALPGWWRTLELPFPMEFYGNSYNTVYLSENGVLAFEEQTQAQFFTNFIPTTDISGPAIMPFWTFSTFSDYLYPLSDIGIFFQAYDDKMIITWSYFTNNFGGMGDPVSAQLIYYKNGTYKMQFKAEEGGADATSRASSIGFQRSVDQGVQIIAYETLDYGSGLAYIIKPANQYSIAPGETLTGNVEINAENIYGGIYEANLDIHTNVPGSKLLHKSVELTVTGEGFLAQLDTVDMGRHLLKLTPWGDPEYTFVDLYLENTGAANVEITWAAQSIESPELNLMILNQGFWGPSWTFITEIYSPWAWETPTYTIKPGDRFTVRAAFGPTASADFENSIVLTTNVGDYTIALKGIGYEPAKINASTSPIEVNMNTLSETANRTFSFDNLEGKSSLDYTLSVDYGRVTSAQRAENIAPASAKAAVELQNEKLNSPNTTAHAQSSYNSVRKHTDRTSPDTFVGTGGSAPFTLATRFNAGPTGFNISHIETFFRAESAQSGVIKAEVRAGGTNIATAVKVAEGTVTFTNAQAVDNDGSWLIITLDQASNIYPNEDFYVIVTYPLGIALPQGTLQGQTKTSGRYSYSSEGNWYDLQDAGGLGDAAWLMFAAEETASNNAWLSILSETSGSLTEGESTEVSLKLDGALGARGDQIAHVVIQHNDPSTGAKRVPVKLHINEAPKFGTVPSNVLISENETSQLEINVTDVENHTINISANHSVGFITHSVSNHVLSIIIAPDFGDEGVYTLSFTATDEHAASSQISMTVEVLHTNRAPHYVHEATTLNLLASGRFVELNIHDFFADIDEDPFSFTVESANSTLIEVFTSKDMFIVKPKTIGTTHLDFVVRDIHGASITHQLPVSINKVLGVNDELETGIRAYPNPTKNQLEIQLDQQWTGPIAIEVLDMAGKLYLSQDFSNLQGNSLKLNLSSLTKGLYVIKVSSSNQQNTVKIIKE